PCVYYGDEIGLEGGKDPDCRRCFDWDRGRWNGALFEHYRAMIGLRKARAELRHGGAQTLVADGEVLALGRFVEGAASVFVVHRGGEPRTLRIPVWQLPVPAAWRTAGGAALPVDDGCVTVTVAPEDSVIVLGD